MGGFRGLQWMICRTNWKVWKHKHLELCKYTLCPWQCSDQHSWCLFLPVWKVAWLLSENKCWHTVAVVIKKTAFHSSFDGCVLSWQTHSAPHVCFTLQIKLIVTENEIFAANDWSTVMWCQRWDCFCECKRLLWEWERTFNYSHDPSQRLWYF